MEQMRRLKKRQRSMLKYTTMSLYVMVHTFMDVLR